MQIDRDVKLLRTLPEGIIARVIEVATVGVPIDHGAAKPQLSDGAFEFVGRRDWILHGKMRETRVTVGTSLNFSCQNIICLPGFPVGDLDLWLGLHARPGDRQNAAFDSGSIHGLQA